MASEVIDKIIYETTSDKTCKVVGYDKNKRPVNVVIPEEVTIEGNSYVVTEICEKAFYSCSTLRSIKLPSSLVEIGAEAFNICYNLKSIAIPSKITILQDYLFHCCTALESVIIPESVTYIGEAVFKACNVLKQVEIPDSVTNIGRFAFQFCYELTQIKLPKGLTHISICSFHGCKALTNISIPESVTSIGSYAFAQCESLTKVDLPQGLTSIDEKAFHDCDKLKGVSFNEQDDTDAQLPEKLYLNAVKKEGDLINLWLYKGELVKLCSKKILIGSKELPANKNNNYYCQNGVLSYEDEENFYVFNGESFVKTECKYRHYNHYFSPDTFCSTKIDKANMIQHIALTENGVEYEFSYKFRSSFDEYIYFPKAGVMLFIETFYPKLRFFSKTGEELWGLEVVVGDFTKESFYYDIDTANIDLESDSIIIKTQKGDLLYNVCYKLQTGEVLWYTKDSHPFLFTGAKCEDGLLRGIFPYNDNGTLCTVLYEMNQSNGNVHTYRLYENEKAQEITVSGTDTRSERYKYILDGNKLYTINSKEILIIDIKDKVILSQKTAPENAIYCQHDSVLLNGQLLVCLYYNSEKNKGKKIWTYYNLSNRELTESPNAIPVETVENEEPKDLKQLELYKGVKYLYIWEGKKVLIYKDKLVIDDLTLPVENAQSYHCEGGVLYQFNNYEEHYQVYRFDGNSFVKDNFRYDFDKYINPNLSCSSEYDEEEKMVKVSIVDNGEESLFEFPSQNNISVLRYDVEHDVLILGVGYNWSKSLHFYTKTGKKLWQYNVRDEKFWIEDEGNLIIVDDVVVITCTNEKNHIDSVAGYNLRTGEKLWNVDDLQYCTHHYEIGPDKMLYYVRNDARKDFYLIQLNPFTGKLKKTLLIKGSNDYIIPKDSKIFGNKFYFTREISEYSYKKCKRTWTLNHIDLDTKEFTEIINSNEHCISIPEFHENKMYIDICWRELRVYEMDGDTPVMVDAPKKKSKTLDDLEEIDVLKAITGCKCAKTKDLSGDYEKLRKEGKEKGFIPVLVGFDDYVRDSICSNIGIVDNTVSLVKKEVKTYHEKMLAMAVEDGKSFLHKKWTAEPTEEDEQRILKAKKSRRNTMEGTFTQNMNGTLYWVKVPVTDPWLIWVYLPYGGWNACPDVKTQIAVSKYWYEQYQALPIGIYGACVDYYLEKPLTTPFKAAKEMYEYCCDIIEQGHNDINILAKDIRDLNFWNFWWD